jgi:hypothetical protein
MVNRGHAPLKVTDAAPDGERMLNRDGFAAC